MARLLDPPADPAMADYVRFHAPRFAYMLGVLERFHRRGGRVLDIGWSSLTEAIHRRFGDPVDALGFDADSTTDTGRYYHLDLNDCQNPSGCRDDLPAYDTIVFAEVLEHLHTSPALVLAWLARQLRPGGVIVVQTPNAVALPRRLKMILGRNPFELIREDATNPGHFREYTASELRTYLSGAGLRVEHLDVRSYFDFRYCRHGQVTRRDHVFGRIKNVCYPLLPRSLRPGLTAVARRPR